MFHLFQTNLNKKCTYIELIYKNILYSYSSHYLTKYIVLTLTCSVQWWIWIEQTTKKCLDRLQIAAHFLERRLRRSLNYILFVRGCCVVARRTFAEHCWALFADSKLINVLLTPDAHTTYILYISSHAIRSPQHTNRTPPLHHKCSFGFRYFCASSFRTNQSSATLAVINCLHSQQADPTHAHTHMMMFGCVNVHWNYEINQNAPRTNDGRIT